MVNRGIRIVNYGPSSDRACSPKDRIFLGRERERRRAYSFAKESKRVKSYMQRLYRPSGTYLSPVLPATYTEPASRVHTLCTFVTVSFHTQAGTSAYIIVLEGERMYIRLLAMRAHVLSLFLSADFNASERRRCANMKGGCAGRERERECLKSRLMIRDDTRHSSLSDVWLDCRYCSLSFILRELSPPTHAYVRQCVRRIKARRA